MSRINRRTFAAGMLLPLISQKLSAEPDKQLRAVLIGVERYTDFLTLTYCADDVKQLGRVLDGLGYDFNPVAVDHSLGGVDLAEGVAALKKAAAACGENDRLVIYFSGHGGTVDGRQYLFFSNSRLYSPDLNGLPLTTLPGRSETSLESVMGTCKARERILIVDACRTPAKGGPAKRVQLIDKVFAKGAEGALRTSPSSTPVRRVVMYSGQEGEAAYPASSRRGSLYTKALLDGLRAGHLQVKDLLTYIRQAVPKEGPQPDVEGDESLWIAPMQGGNPPADVTDNLPTNVVYLTSLKLLRSAREKPRSDVPCKMDDHDYAKAVTLPILEGREVAAYYVPVGAVWFEATWGVHDDYNGTGSAVATFSGISPGGRTQPLGATGIQNRGSMAEKIRVRVYGQKQFCIRTTGMPNPPGIFFLGEPRFTS